MTARETLEGIFDNDLKLVVGFMATLWVVYFVLGAVLGYDVNGIANALRGLTFWAAVYALCVLALNLHWGYAGLFNIGVAGFMAVGAYTMAIAVNPVNPTSSGAIPGFGLPLPVGIVIGMIAAAIVGLIAALPALRLRADYLAIVTIGISEIIRLSFKSVTLKEFTVLGKTFGTGGGSGLVIDNNPASFINDFLPAPSGLPVTQSVIEGWIYAIALLGFVALFYWTLARVGNSPFGRVLRAIREDEDAASSLGKNTPRFKVKAFMLGCALMGLAGMLWQASQGFVNPGTFKPELTFYIWIALIIGGAGSNTGSVLGGLLFAGVLFQGPLYVKNVVEKALNISGNPESLIAALQGPIEFLAYTLNNMGAIRFIFTGVVLIWLMQNRPEGLLGHRKEPAAAIPILGTQREQGADAVQADSIPDDAGSSGGDEQ